jgi:hypothetical protein
MTISTEPAQPDVVGMTDIETMTLQEFETELRSYEPATAAAVAYGDEHRARRARLWARLDTLTRSGAGGPPTRSA